MLQTALGQKEVLGLISQGEGRGRSLLAWRLVSAAFTVPPLVGVLSEQTTAPPEDSGQPLRCLLPAVQPKHSAKTAMGKNYLRASMLRPVNLSLVLRVIS